MGREDGRHEHEQDGRTWKTRGRDDFREERRWQPPPEHAHDLTKDPSGRGGDMDSLSPHEVAFQQRGGTPRMRMRSPSHHPQPQPQPHRPHSPSTPPLPPQTQLAPVREDTIPSYGVATGARFHQDYSVKEEDDRMEKMKKREEQERHDPRDGIGHPVQHSPHPHDMASPFVYPTSNTPQQSSPSLSASTPPANNTTATTLGAAGTTIDPSSGNVVLLGDSSSSSSRKPRPYPCAYPGCGRVFEKRCNMLSHHWTHFPSEMPRHPCPTCGKSFTRMHDVQRHISTVHEGSRNFVCAGCRRAFARRNGLNRHQQQSELCKGAGVLTPAEAAAIGGLPPAVARGPRGRKPPLHMAAAMAAGHHGPDSNRSSRCSSTSSDMDYVEGGGNDAGGPFTTDGRHPPFPSQPPPPPSGSNYSDTNAPSMAGSASHSSVKGENPSDPPKDRMHEALARAPLQYEREGDEGNEFDDEEDQEEEDAYYDEGIDQLQDDYDGDPEEEVDQLIHDEEPPEPAT
ncbi:hypothetical protein BGZ73_002589 [Actinomortierella ambigua]|nr:hypothetical protein BGZ73_002589 [Actinomortierella ambigua]